MSRSITFSARQTKVRPRPLVGTRTWIKQTERAMRDSEFSGSMGDFMRALTGRLVRKPEPLDLKESTP